MEVFLHKNDIPKSCKDCCFKSDYSDFNNIFCDIIYCNITRKIVNNGGCEFESERHKDCPLKTVETETQQYLNEWIGR